MRDNHHNGSQAYNVPAAWTANELTFSLLHCTSGLVTVMDDE